jgi:hypothetical protein
MQFRFLLYYLTRGTLNNGAIILNRSVNCGKIFFFNSIKVKKYYKGKSFTADKF